MSPWMTPSGAPKPYALLPFAADRKRTNPPQGHDRVVPGTVTGVVELTITTLTPIHSAYGIPDFADYQNGRGKRRVELALFPVLRRVGKGDAVVLLGSSLKGMARSLHEAITASCVPTQERKTRNALPPDLRACRGGGPLCPSCRVFGALNYQGHVSFEDIVLPMKYLTPLETPLLWTPGGHGSNLAPRYLEGREARGRKFYHHRRPAGGADLRMAVKKNLKIPAKMHVENLKPVQLGAVFCALGLHPEYRFPIKFGAAKPVGLGSIRVEVKSLQLGGVEDLHSRGRLGRAPGRSDPERVEKWAREATEGNPSLVDLASLQGMARILDENGLKQDAPHDAY